MSLPEILDSVFLLQFIKFLIFIFGFVFSTCILIPRGVNFLIKWYEVRNFSLLASGVNSIVGGIAIIVYLLSVFIAESIKTIR